ncbi:MAG: hypothetical protein BGN88_12125 [Clostridiales bacterium 43-6]|nr:MAG: hypothetical protein BGN88_12125 [Clostridiales bacterium 43-6]
MIRKLWGTLPFLVAMGLIPILIWLIFTTNPPGSPFYSNKVFWDIILRDPVFWRAMFNTANIGICILIALSALLIKRTVLQPLKKFWIHFIFYPVLILILFAVIWPMPPFMQNLSIPFNQILLGVTGEFCVAIGLLVYLINSVLDYFKYKKQAIV